MIIENYYVFVLYVVGLVFLIWECIAFLRFKNKIVISGKMPSQNITFPIIAVLFCYIILNNFGMSTSTYGLCALYIVIFTFVLFLNCGICEQGIVVQGSLSKYSRIRYYNIDQQTSKKPRLRFGLGFQEKFLEIPEDKIQLATAYFFKYGVPSFEEYVLLKKEAKRKDLEGKSKK